MVQVVLAEQLQVEEKKYIYRSNLRNCAFARIGLATVSQSGGRTTMTW